MFKRWLQDRLQRKREAISEDDGSQKSQDDSIKEDDTPVEVAVEALLGEAETENVSNSTSDDGLHLHLASQTECHVMPADRQVLRSGFDNFPSQNLFSSEAVKETIICSQPHTMSCENVGNLCVSSTTTSVQTKKLIPQVVEECRSALDKHDSVTLGVDLVSITSSVPISSSESGGVEISPTQSEVQDHITVSKVRNFEISSTLESSSSLLDAQESVPSQEVDIENAKTHSVDEIYDVCIERKENNVIPGLERKECIEGITAGLDKVEDQKRCEEDCTLETKSHVIAISDNCAVTVNDKSSCKSSEASDLHNENIGDGDRCDWKEEEENIRGQEQQNKQSDVLASLLHNLDLDITQVNDNMNIENQSIQVKTEAELCHPSSATVTELLPCNINDPSLLSGFHSHLIQSYDKTSETGSSASLSSGFNNHLTRSDDKTWEIGSFEYEVQKSDSQIHSENKHQVLGENSTAATELSQELIHQQSDDACLYPSPCCLRLSCLYNQQGKLCSVLGQHFILTYVKQAPVLVDVKIQDSNLGPFGCLFVWKESRPIVLNELPDGTDIYFDAVVMPDITKIIALVIWQDYRPQISIEPYFNSYIFLEEFKNLQVHFKKCGLVNVVIDDKIEVIRFHKDVVFIDGRNIQSVDEITKLSKCDSQQIFADVCKFVKVDVSGQVTYTFLCSLIWSGSRPHVTSPLKPLKTSVLYTIPASSDWLHEGLEQLLLYCGVLVNLIVTDNCCYLKFEGDCEEIILPCPREVIYHGNKKTELIKEGKVRAHIRKHSKCGKLDYKAVMVQISDATINHVERDPSYIHGKEMQLCPIQTSREICVPFTEQSVQNVDPAEVNFSVNERTLNSPMTGLQSDVESTNNINTFGKSEISLNRIDDGNSVKFPCSDDRLLGQTQDAMPLTKLGKAPIHSVMKPHETTLNVEEGVKEVPNMNSDTKTNLQTHFCKLDCIGPKKDYPHVHKNLSGKLCWIADTKSFNVLTCINGSPFKVHVGKSAWIVDRDKVVKVDHSLSDISVFLDVCFDTTFLHGYRIVAMWVGRKPFEAFGGKTTYFYDVPGVYCGLDESDTKFTVSLNDCIVPIKTSCCDRVFTLEGKECRSIPVGASVVLHLRKKLDQLTGAVFWQTLLIIVQLKQDKLDVLLGTDMQRELLSGDTNTQYEPVLSSSVLSSSLQPYPSIVETPKTNLSLDTLSLSSHESSVEIQQFISAKDLPRYIRSYPGILMQNKEDEFALFSCVDGVALWTSISKDSFICVDEKAVDIKSIALGSGVMFDGICDNASSVQHAAVLMWIGSRPRHVRVTDDTEYFYDVECVYQDDFLGQFQLVMKTSSQNECVIVEKTDHVYFSNGRRALCSLNKKDKITVHLKKGRDMYGIKWVALAVFIKATKENIVSSPSDTRSQSSKSVNLESVEQHKLETLNVSTEEESSDKSMYNVREVLLGKENCAIHLYSVLEGDLEVVCNSGYNFTYVREGCTNNLIIPVDIALDRPTGRKSAKKFYLIARNKFDQKGCTMPLLPVCGWFQKKNHDAYVIHCLKVYSYKPKTKLICLIDQQDQSVHYFIYDREYIFMGQSKKPVKDAIKDNVHAVVEDITPCVIDGYPVHKRVLIITSNMSLSLVALKFLTLSHIDNEVNENKLEVPSDSEDVNTKCPDLTTTSECSFVNCTLENCSQKLTHTPVAKEKSSVSKEIKEGCTSLTENHLASTETNRSDYDLTISAGNKKGQLVDRLHDHFKQRSKLSGELLRQAVDEKSSMPTDTVHSSRYLTLNGKLDISSETFLFEFNGVSRTIPVSPDIPSLNWKTPQNKGINCYLFVHRVIKKETEEEIYHPFFIWHREKKCRPYIFMCHSIDSYDRENHILSLNNVGDFSVQRYIFTNNCVFTGKGKKDITQFFEIVANSSIPFYAVVEDTEPVYIAHSCLNRRILLMTSSLSVALFSINTFTCKKTEHDKFLCNMNSTSNILAPQKICELEKLFQMYEKRRHDASSCEMGYLYYLYANKFDTEYNMSGLGGCLESHTETHAYILCKKKTMTAVCKKSDVYYQGKGITSWDDIELKYWKNFFAITLPLEEVVTVQNRKVDALALLSWSCSGPAELLTIHVCDLHEPTLIGFKGVPSEGNCKTAIMPPVDNELRPKLSSVKCGSIVDTALDNKENVVLSQDVLSLNYHENIENTNDSGVKAHQCLRGNSVFSFHEDILLSCGLEKKFGNFRYCTNDMVVFTSQVGEMIWCELSSLYISGVQCNFIDEGVDPTKSFCLIVKHAPAITLGDKTINLKAVLGFTKNKNLPGIHVCSNHTGILLTNMPEEELNIARQTFSDIERILVQSDDYTQYFCKSLHVEDALPLLAPLATDIVNHTESCGVLQMVTAADPNTGIVRIEFQGTEHHVLLERKILVGLKQDIALSDIVGFSLKVILNKNFRISIAWINTTTPSALSSYFSMIKTYCLPKNTEGLCCPRATVVQHFESVKNNTFGILHGYIYKGMDDEGSDVIEFHCQLGSKVLPVKCKKQSVMASSNCVHTASSPWNVLVHFYSPLLLNKACTSLSSLQFDEYLDGVGAWKGTCPNVVVQVCNVHKVQVLDVTLLKKSEAVVKALRTQPRERYVSESLPSDGCILVPLYERNKDMNQSDPSIDKSQLSCSVAVNHRPWSFGSLPGNLNMPELHSYKRTTESFTCTGCDSYQGLTDDENKYKIDNIPAMTTLNDCSDLSSSSMSLTKETTGFINNDPVNVAQISPDSGMTSKTNVKCRTKLPEAAMCVTDDPRQCSKTFTMGKEQNHQAAQEESVLYVKSCDVDIVDIHKGIIQYLGTSILFESDRLYVDTLHVEKPLVDVIMSKETYELEALVTRLPSPISVLSYHVTHKALIVWHGQKPQEVRTLLATYDDLQKTYETVSDKVYSDSNTSSHDKGDSDVTTSIPDSGDASNIKSSTFTSDIPDKGHSEFSTDDEQSPDQCDNWYRQDNFMHVIDGKPHIVRNCIFRNCDLDFGILMSDSGYVLFARELLYKHKRPHLSRSKQLMNKILLKSANAIIMKLQQPIDIFECKVTNVALLVWIGLDPESIDNENMIKAKLNTYKNDYIVELHQEQLRKRSFLLTGSADQIERYHLFDTADITLNLKEPTQSSPETQAYNDRSTALKLGYNDNSTCKSIKSLKIIIRHTSHHETRCCRPLLIYEEFAIMHMKEVMAIARREDFYIGDAKMFPSFPLYEQLKPVFQTTKTVICCLAEVAQPVCVQEHVITHFALFAYGGKQPTTHESILARWQTKASHIVHISFSKDSCPVKGETALPLLPKGSDEQLNNSEESLPSVPKCSKVSHSIIGKSTEDMLVSVKKDFIPYFNLSRNKKFFETNTAKICKLTKTGGILEVQNENLENGNAKVFFNIHSSCVYINKEMVVDAGFPLVEHIGPLKDKYWNCSARMFFKNSRGDVRKIMGVEVQFIANMVWYGDKLTRKELEDKKISEENTTKKIGSKDLASGNTTSTVKCKTNGTLAKKPASGEIHKPETVAERLRKQMLTAQSDSQDAIQINSGARPKVKKPSMDPWSSKQECSMRGCITELHKIHGRLRLESGEYVYFSREKSFLYGVRLDKVELWHVLSIGMDVDYELTDDKKDIKGIWVGGISTLTTSNLFTKLKEWCEMYSVPQAAMEALLAEAGWLPEDFNPTLNVSDNREVVVLKKSSKNCSAFSFK